MTARAAENALSRLQNAREINAQDVSAILAQVYADGVVSRAEAEALFALNDRLALADAHWYQRFPSMMTDFLLEVEPPLGWLTEEEVEWLIARVTRDGVVRAECEMELVLRLLREAAGAPARLGQFALQAVCDRIRAEGRADLPEVERLRRVLFAPAGQGAIWITRDEANALFDLNDTIGRAANHKAWNDLFARAIANHLMALVHPTPDNVTDALAREKWLQTGGQGVGAIFAGMLSGFADNTWFEKITYDPRKAEAARVAAREAAARKAAEIEPEEQAWFLRRLGWDKRITPAERALVEFLKDEAPGLVNGLALAA